MKRIFLLLTVAAMTAFTGCSSDDDRVDRDTISEVFEINQNTTFTAANNYSINYTLNPQIYSSDMILVYRLSGTSGGNDVWEALPQTYFFNGGADDLMYTFDFSINDINIYIDSTFPAEEAPAFSVNQVFRVLIIPAYNSGAKTANAVDLTDYNAVMQAYNLSDKNIKTIGDR